jgi:hypothetical protein
VRFLSSVLAAVVVFCPTLLFGSGFPTPINASDIVISGSSHIVIRNETVNVASNVIIQDNAVVEIYGGTLNFVQSRNQEWSWTVRGNSRLILNGVTLSFVNNYWMNFSYVDNAFVSFTDVPSIGPLWQVLNNNAQVVVNNSPIGITPLARSTGSVTITNSPSVWFELGLPSGTYDGSVPNGFVTNFNLALGYHLAVANSTIRRIDIDLSPGVNVTLRDTTIVGIGWNFGLGTPHAPAITINGLKRQHYADATFIGDNSSLRLVNTALSEWWPVLFNDFILNVTNCTLADPHVNHTSQMNISDSYLTLVVASDSAVARIATSTITDSLSAFGFGLIELTNVVFSGQMNTSGAGRIVRDGVRVAP